MVMDAVPNVKFKIIGAAKIQHKILRVVSLRSKKCT